MAATLQEDEAACEATVDSNGDSCAWCEISDTPLCLTPEQAALIEQFGGDCASSDATEQQQQQEEYDMDEEEEQDEEDTTTAIIEQPDPFDTTCLTASITQDESTCESTLDSNGDACEWCNLQGSNICLTPEQAELIEQVGGQCADNDEEQEDEEGEDEEEYVDASSCELATFDQDPYACQESVDGNDEYCSWCILSSSIQRCLSSEQAAAAMLLGADCSGEEYEYNDEYEYDDEEYDEEEEEYEYDEYEEDEEEENDDDDEFEAEE